MKGVVLYFIVIFGSFISASAQNIDVVYTSDGSSYSGIISEQIPGDKITVSTNLAIKYVDSDKISDIIYANTSVSSLIQPLKSWMENNKPDCKEVELASMKIFDAKFDNVIILEKGEKMKLLIGGNAQFILKWSNIVRTTKSVSKSKDFGIKELVILKNGKVYEGNITEQFVGKQLAIKTDMGDVINVNIADVDVIKTERRNLDQNIWMQIRYLDKVEFTDGTTIKGFISSRSLGKSITYITESNDKEITVELSKVKRYGKVKNGKFNAEKELRSQIDNASTKKQEVVPSKPTKEADPPKDIPENKKSAETKSTPKQIAKMQPDKHNIEEVDNSANKYSINGDAVVANKVVETSNKSFLIYNIYAIDSKGPITKVSHKEPIIIELQGDIDMTNVHIVKTEQRSVKLGVDEFGKMYQTFTRRDINKSTVNFSYAIIDKTHMEVKINTIEQGVYVLYPIVVNGHEECLMFEVI